MGLTCTGGDREICMALSGEVDHHHARGLMTEIEREIDRELPKHVTLDLGGVTFMDSSGIAVVLRCYRRTAELGGGGDGKRCAAPGRKGSAGRRIGAAHAVCVKRCAGGGVRPRPRRKYIG